MRELVDVHTGKVFDKWSCYLEAYNRIFAPICDRELRLLEIGIQNGGSLEIWAKYFADAARIVGCDIDEACRALTFDDPRIQVVVGDINSPEVRDSIVSLGPFYDLIIDDGSHKSGDIIRSFVRYFPLLEEGGLFVVEDLHCSYWEAFDGGLLHPASSMAFFKRLADAVNHEHWGVLEGCASLFASFARIYDFDVGDSVLGTVESVHFSNSLCVIRKKTPAGAQLGSRIVVGNHAAVDAAPIAEANSLAKPMNQSSNQWSQVHPLPEDELTALRLSSAQFQTEKATLEWEIATLQSEKTDLQMLKADLEMRLAQVQTEKATLEWEIATLQSEKTDLQMLKADLEMRLAQVTELRRLDASRLEIQERHCSRTAREAEELRFKVLQLEHGVGQLNAQVAQRQAMIDAIFKSTSWRVSVPVRWTGRRLESLTRRAGMIRSLSHRARMIRSLSHRVGGPKRLVRLGWDVFRCSGISGVTSKLRVLKPEGLARLDDGDHYERIARQIFAEQQAEVDRAQAIASIGEFARTPLISVIMPVYATPIQWLQRAVESLRDQYYENWELCVVDDCSPTDEQRELLKDMAAQDARIRVKTMEKNSGISTASNAGLAMARGEFIALLDHDDELTKDALYWIASEINRQPDADFIYTDECKIDDTSQRGLFHFVFKPDWSPEIMFNGMLTGHLTIYSTRAVREIGGFRSKYDFSQDYDLALRMSEVARKIVHVERVLYLWRSIPGSAANGDKRSARESNIGALNDAVIRRSIPGVALPLEHANCVRIAIPEEVPLVSIIIPSDSMQNLRTALDTIRARTEYPNFEVIVVCNGPLAERLKDTYADVSQFSFVHYNEKYNFSDKCNEGARAANGEFVVFYNDDVFPTQSDWIERLIELLYVPGVEGVSPKLLYENNTIQYAGMISGTPGLVGTAYNNVPRDGGDSFLSMHRYVRNVSVLSGACCALRKDTFWAVGGFDPVNTPDGHSDMDLSYKLIRAGYRCVYTPYSVLYHLGNGSWSAKRGKYKADIFVLKRWGAYVSRDPNFTESMKRVLYRDFMFQYRIFAAHIDPDASYDGPDVLFVSHELSLTGAPRMLFYAAMAVRQRGGFPVVVAPTDGPIRAELEAAGIVVIVDASIRDGHFLFERFARNFDVVVVNTLALANVVRQLGAIDGLDVVWWLHEGKAIAEEAAVKQSTAGRRVRLICISKYAHKFLPRGGRAEVLHNGIPDRRDDVGVASRPERVTFVLAGTLERRKAQDLFVEAIALLPERVRENCRFLLTGKLWEENRSYWKSVQATMATMPEVKYLGLLNHRDLLDLVARSDVLVCCSRDEPFSLVALEAAMLGKPSILSTNVGSVEVLGTACAVFESDNASALAEQILHAFENRDAMARMGEAARKVFERELTLEVFSERFFLKVLQDTSVRQASSCSRSPQRVTGVAVA
jgi:GT2 family glycosyltransferase